MIQNGGMVLSKFFEGLSHAISHVSETVVIIAQENSQVKIKLT